MIERYAFISPEHHNLDGVRAKFPNLVKYGESYIVQYASPSDSNAMMELVNSFNLELVHYSQCDAQMIIDAIEGGMGNTVYNCNHDVALEVCQHFTTPEA